MKKYILILILFFASFGAILPFFHDGFFHTHDDPQLARVFEMGKALKEGQFPVRWVADLGYGYGYPIFNFYGPIPYYFGGSAVLFGATTLTATKFMFVLGILLSVFFMFLLVKRICGYEAALLSSVLYLYAPYHAVDVYVRGAVDEFWGMAFLPLVFYSLYGFLENKDKDYKDQIKDIVLGSVTIAFLISSHNISAMLLFFFLGFYLLAITVVYRSLKLILNHLLTFTLAFGLSAFYALPAIFEMKYTNIQTILGGGFDIRRHFVYLFQLWDSPWGFGGSAPGPDDGLSFKIGKLLIFLALIGFTYLIRNAVRKKHENNPLFFFSFFIVFIGVMAVFMTLSVSQPIWDLFSFLSFTQFPWRFLMFVAFSFSFLGGMTVLFVKGKLRLILACLLGVLFMFINIKYFEPQRYISINPKEVESSQYLEWQISKLSDEYLPRNFPKPFTADGIVANKIETTSDVILLNQNFKSDDYVFTVNAKKDADLTINTAYFPGWQVFLDKTKTSFQVVNGVMTIHVREGIHQVKIKFSDTVVRKIGNLISLATLFIIIFLILRFYNKKISIIIDRRLKVNGKKN